MLVGADKSDVALLVVGDPLGATTHTDLMLRASEMGVKVKVCNSCKKKKDFCVFLNYIVIVS